MNLHSHPKTIHVPLGGGPEFLMATCQVGGEIVLKREMERLWPSFRAAYSRPGFVTFRLPERNLLQPGFDPGVVFARTAVFSIGKINGATDDSDAAIAQAAAEVRRRLGDRQVRWVHVWERDAAVAGTRGQVRSVCESGDRKPMGSGSPELPGLTESALDVMNISPAEPVRYEPGNTDRTRRVAAAIVAEFDDPAMLALACRMNPFFPAVMGEDVLDVVLVGPDEWWVGFHRVGSRIGQMAGGLLPLTMPPDVVSRAWLKMEEALWWSEFPIAPGDRCAEIGSAPGGASQALLARGVELAGVDPAEMSPDVLQNPRFTHIRKRAHEVRRRVFHDVQWLTADMNVAPDYTLDSVEAIVTHPGCGVRGMILTLKLFQWTLADEIPRFLDRIRDWGFHGVRARQLQYNRQEICVVCER